MDTDEHGYKIIFLPKRIPLNDGQACLWHENNGDLLHFRSIRVNPCSSVFIRGKNLVISVVSRYVHSMRLQIIHQPQDERQHQDHHHNCLVSNNPFFLAQGPQILKVAGHKIIGEFFADRLRIGVRLIKERGIAVVGANGLRLP